MTRCGCKEKCAITQTANNCLGKRVEKGRQSRRKGKLKQKVSFWAPWCLPSWRAQWQAQSGSGPQCSLSPGPAHQLNNCAFESLSPTNMSWAPSKSFLKPISLWTSSQLHAPIEERIQSPNPQWQNSPKNWAPLPTFLPSLLACSVAKPKLSRSPV